MSQYQVVSRKDLYDDQSSTSTIEVGTQQVDTYRHTPELELVEVDVPTISSGEPDVNQTNDEFDFPLFSFGVEDQGTETAAEAPGDQHAINSGGPKLMKVSLREPIYVTVKQERPKAYYFSSPTDEERLRYKKSALDYDTILRDASLGPYQGWYQFRGPVMDVQEHNKKVELELLREKRLKRRRPGRKQRLARAAAQDRQKEREQKLKEIKKMIKKKFHKRGGKKNKKKPEPVTPQFRTE